MKIGVYVGSFNPVHVGHIKIVNHLLVNYLDKVNLAVDRAKEFTSDTEGLVDEIGCNLWKLIESMKAYQ